ncbi:hypothetical protein [Kitasatospora kazusensis]|uniref:SCO2583/SCO2584 N-terminal domain-containing protein n=1 Tax=Kitasatospora kazusensis TaxID=407974 RepID=UPI0031D5801B
MPTAEDPERPADGPPDDPFEGLVLDEDFVRAATVKEKSARARMLTAQRRREPPALRRAGAGPGRSLQTLLIVLCVGGLSLLGLGIGPGGQSPAPRPVRSGPAGTDGPPASPSTTPSGPWPASPALRWPDGRMK